MNYFVYKVLFFIALITSLFMGGSIMGVKALGFSTPLYLALASFPLIWQTRFATHSPSPLALGLGLMLAVLFLLQPLQPLYFLIVWLLGLAIAEGLFGKQGLLPYLLLFFASPIFSYAVQVLGFPIRLWLSTLGSMLLSIIHPETKAIGNGIYWGGRVFWVDEACIGLQMGGTATVLSMAILGYWTKKKGKQLKTLVLLTMACISCLLFIWANLTRLISIVLMQAEGGSAIHQALGLLSMGLYVLLPLYGLGYLLTKVSWAWKEKGSIQEPNTSLNKTKVPLGFACILLLLTALLPLNIHQEKQFSTQHPPVEVLPQDIRVKHLGNSIWQASSTQKGLWYCKGPLLPYRSDHSPTVCWKGSGYKFREIVLVVEGEDRYYKAQLQKEGEPSLFTAWWYQSKKNTTKIASQWTWRTNAFRSTSPYYLLNVTAESRERLAEILEDN